MTSFIPHSAMSRSRLTLRELVTLVLYDRQYIVAGFAIPLFVGLFAALTASGWYESTARLLVLPGPTYLAKSPLTADPNGPGLLPTQILTAEAELIDNRKLLLDVVDSLGPSAIYGDLGPGDREAALLRLQADLSVEPIFAAGVIRLALRNREAKSANVTLDRIIKTYQDSRLATVADRTIEPMEAQEKQLEERLRQAEDALHQFSVGHGLSDFEAEREHLLRMRLDLLANQREAEALVQARKAELDTARAQFASVPSAVQGPDSKGRVRDLEDAKASLLTLELRRKDLASRISEDSEDVRNIDLQIATVKGFVESEPARVQDSKRQARNPAYDEGQRRVASLEADVDGLQARAATAAENVARTTARLTELEGYGPTYARLQEAEKTAEQAFMEFRPKIDEARIRDEASRLLPSNVRVIEEATMPTRPHRRSRLYLMLGLFAGLVGAASATLVRFSMRQYCLMPHEMEQWTRLPALLVVNRTEARA